MQQGGSIKRGVGDGRRVSSGRPTDGDRRRAPTVGLSTQPERPVASAPHRFEDAAVSAVAAAAAAEVDGDDETRRQTGAARHDLVVVGVVFWRQAEDPAAAAAAAGGGGVECDRRSTSNVQRQRRRSGSASRDQQIDASEDSAADQTQLKIVVLFIKRFADLRYV